MCRLSSAIVNGFDEWEEERTRIESVEVFNNLTTVKRHPEEDKQRLWKQGKSVTLPLLAMSCSFYLPPCLLVSGISKEAREENEIPVCIYSSPYFPSILTRRQTIVINFISDCLPKALVNVTRNLTVEIIVDNPHCVYVCAYICTCICI